MTDKATGGARVCSNDWLGMTAPTPEMMAAASAVDIDWVEASECCCFSDAEIHRLWHAMCTVPNSPVQRMRTAIERALADSESGDGWGPDVTVCGYLREALLQPNTALGERRHSPWRPIETAPVDGTEVLAWRADCGVLLVRYTSPEAFLSEQELERLAEEDSCAEGWFCADFVAGCRLDGGEIPTHWMPLPLPPNAGVEPLKVPGATDGK